MARSEISPRQFLYFSTDGGFLIVIHIPPNNY